VGGGLESGLELMIGISAGKCESRRGGQLGGVRAESTRVTNNDDVKAPDVEDLRPGEAREVLGPLWRRGGAIQKAVAEEIEAYLRTVDVNVVAGRVFTDLDLLTRKDLWDRSGETLHGYSHPAEVAWEMVEEVIRPYLGEIDRYWKVGMKEPAPGRKFGNPGYGMWNSFRGCGGSFIRESGLGYGRLRDLGPEWAAVGP